MDYKFYMYPPIMLLLNMFVHLKDTYGIAVSKYFA